MAIGIDERVNTSDLDLLDDANAHARCTVCHPHIKTLEPITALCGTRAVQRPGPPLSIPANACEACVELWTQPCARCGH